ncbi:MAG: hypothetical protein IH899_16040 [Planctomycetes bacterium]|nr:hypothetical protein [Planctomycetota bacterium]
MVNLRTTIRLRFFKELLTKHRVREPKFLTMIQSGLQDEPHVSALIEKSGCPPK